MPVLLAGQAPEGLWDALATQVRDRDFELRRGDCGGANGLTHYIDRTVTVRADVDDAQAVKTLAHELAHVLLHDPTGLATVTVPGIALTAGDPILTPDTLSTTAGQCRGRLEVEAESVAYLVASAHGLDTGAYTFAYVAGWASEVAGAEVDQVVRGTANRVLAAARVVLAATEHLLEPTSDEQILAQDLTLAADTAAEAARGAERTTALLNDATSTAETAQRMAADIPTAPPASTPLSPALAGGPARAATHPTPERLLEVHRLAVDFYASGWAPAARTLAARLRCWPSGASTGTAPQRRGLATRPGPGQHSSTTCAQPASTTPSSAPPAWS